MVATASQDTASQDTAAREQAGSEAGGGEDMAIVLGLLTAVEQNQNITQRSLAQELNIALGLVNTYVKRLIRKGHLKVSTAPLNRYSYYLTPKGFAEKARLTTEYLSYSLTFFRQARRECAALLDGCASVGWQRIALAGVGDLAEIATLCTNDRVTITAVIDPGFAGETFAQMPVVDSIARAGEVDAVLVTELKHPQATYDALVLELEEGRVLAPPLLRIVTPGEAAEAEAQAAKVEAAEAQAAEVKAAGGQAAGVASGPSAEGQAG